MDRGNVQNIEVDFMSAAENKETIRKMGEAKSLDEMLGFMADDVRWTLIGNTRFSGTPQYG